MADNVIAQLTRYSVRSSQDPSENRLTAGLATVLAQSQILSRAVLQAWGLSVPPGPVSVRPQTAIGPGFIDMEIVVGDARLPSARIWIEAKVHSPLSGPNQLSKYAAALENAACSGPKQLLLLLPAHERRRYRTTKVLSGRVEAAAARLVTWQEVHSALAKARHRLKGHSGWFAQQYVEFLEMEGLMPPPKLTSAHLDTLAKIQDAQDALDELLEEIRSAVRERRGEHPTRPYKANGYVEHALRAGPGWNRDTQFLWGIEGREIFASVYGLLDGLTRPAGHSSIWIEAAERSGLKREDGARGWAYWTKRDDLKTAARGRSSEDQAANAAAWILDAFAEFDRLREEVRQATRSVAGR